VSSPQSPPDPARRREEDEEGRAAAVAALQAAFTRLQPQGSDAWNFLAAFTHLANRYTAPRPEGSELSLDPEERDSKGSRGTETRRRLRQKLGVARAGAGDPDGSDDPSELEQAMLQVVEAFRFLSARVRTLEEWLASVDRPVDGAAWLAPARELESWVDPVASHIIDATPGGDVLHGDCGDGALLRVLEMAGVPARGAEPRGSVALGALEQGRAVSLAEVADELATRPLASLGGLVLSGVVDRLPLHSLVSLLDRSRHTLVLGAPIVIVASDPETNGTGQGALARDLLSARPLHADTWRLLLQRAGFVSIASLEGDGSDDARFALSALASK
jgi:hypothetical protein